MAREAAGGAPTPKSSRGFDFLVGFMLRGRLRRT